MNWSPFLVDVCGVSRVAARLDATATYHDSCSGLRELGVRDQPRRLLATVEGLALAEMRDANVCCGFGGTFCVKYPDISNAIVGKKAADIAATGAGLLLAGDLGCLMNMAGKLQRDGRAIEVRHVAEVLAGMTEEPAIGCRPSMPTSAAGGPAQRELRGSRARSRRRADDDLAHSRPRRASRTTPRRRSPTPTCRMR